MLLNPMTVEISVESQPRARADDPTQVPFTFTTMSCSITNSWGLQPATALIEAAAVNGFPLIQPMAQVTIKTGGHVFVGIAKEVTDKLGTDGKTMMKEFLDLREFLQWDTVYCLFNRRENKTQNGNFVRRYWHILPADYDTGRKTYTNTPYTGQQIINYIMSGPNIGSPWLTVYNGFMDLPIYDFDCLSGKKLGTALVEISERYGLHFTVLECQPGIPAYTLYWTLKGYGYVPDVSDPEFPFPAYTDNRRTGLTMSGAPSRIRILGNPNCYQVLNLAMEADWAASYQNFFDIDIFADFIFKNFSTPVDIGGVGARTAYNSVDGDVDGLIGRQLAKARALEITVGDFANAMDELGGNGNNYRDYRKFNSRSRMGMPVALYIKTILFRAFRPPANFRLNNYNGQNVDVYSLEIQERGLVEVTHDPVTGEMDWTKDVVTATNGYAIARGYQVGMDAFKTLHPDKFNIESWTGAQNVWQRVEFHADDSGDGNQFILFDEPIINSADLFEYVELEDGSNYPVLKLAPVITVPLVQAGLTFAAERFSLFFGIGSRDDVENVDGLNGEFVVYAGEFGVSELPYADGEYAADKAEAIANSLLNQQYYYATGGYRHYGLTMGAPPTLLSSVIDRVSVNVSAEGIEEQVDFTNERSRSVGPGGALLLTPERDFDRRATLQTLLPGQRELKVEANQFNLLGIALKQNPKFLKTLHDAMFDLYGFDTPPQTTFIAQSTQTGAVMPVGTPLWRDVGGKLPVSPGTSVQTPVFVGVTAMSNQPDNGPVRITACGVDGVWVCQVTGPVSANDPVGLATTPATDTGGMTSDEGAGDGTNVGNALVGTPTIVVGTALDDVGDGETSPIRVRMGGGGSSGASIVVMKVVSYDVADDFLMAVEFDFATDLDESEDTDDANSVAVALPWDLQQDQKPDDDYNGVVPIIYKTYEENDIILAIKNPKGGTGVVDDNGDDVIYMDKNVGARDWAYKIAYLSSDCTTTVYRYWKASKQMTS